MTCTDCKIACPQYELRLGLCIDCLAKRVTELLVACNHLAEVSAVVRNKTAAVTPAAAEPKKTKP